MGRIYSTSHVRASYKEDRDIFFADFNGGAWYGAG